MIRVTLLTFCFALALNSNSQNTVCLTIEANPNPGHAALGGFTKYVDVLGTMGIYAESSISDEKVLHAAAITAELLDNDEDGIVDDQQLKAKLIANNTIMPVFAYDGSPVENTFYNNFNDCGGAVLYNDEVDPNNPTQWGMDASLEEILHTINVCGHNELYPTVFGFSSPTQLTDAMDTARGGHFTTIPTPYPSNAWYTYDDNTCDYECMAVEYLYWCIAANMGALSNVCSGISNEWLPCTPCLLHNIDDEMFNIITDPQWKLPQRKPDGNYCPPTCLSPTAGFCFSDIGLAVSFNNLSNVLAGGTYAWDFGDNSGTSTQQDPSYTYTTSGTYDVCLIIEDTCGTDTICQSITIANNPGTGIIEPNTNELLNLYPNPGEDLINIEIKENNPSALHINDIRGGLIEIIEIKKGNNQINISKLNKGMYFISVGPRVVFLIKH